MESLQQPTTYAVLLSHLHSDHVSYYPLKTLEAYRLPVYVHEDNLEDLKSRHFRDYGFKELQVNYFTNRTFCIGDFKVRSFAVPHMPGFETCGFEIEAEEKKIIIATDFLDWSKVFDRFVDADFIFVESNHDLKLLRKYYNPNSAFHLPNPDTAELLLNVHRHSRRTIQSVMLGHISSQRNTPEIALNETRKAFLQADVPMSFELLAAPLKEPSCTVRIV